MNIRKYRHYLGNAYRNILKWFVGVIPKDNNLILFSAWFGKKYSDNSKYLFEYMLSHSNYNVFWFTKDYTIYTSLKEKKIPCVYSKTIKAKWYQCRAKMLVATVQTSDFNTLLLNKCIYLDLDHAFPGKPVALAQPEVNDAWVEWYHFCKKGLDFYQTASSRFVVELFGPWYDVQPDHFIFCNKPRIDVLCNKELQKGINLKVDELAQGRRILSYLPTHRSCGRKKMNIQEILDLSQIQKICEASGSVFLIKKHFYHRNEKENLLNYPNIFDITNDDIDTQVLLAKTDVLITDFSSCFNDFLALDRPIVFYAYDYDDYFKNDRDYFWKYDVVTGGYTEKTKIGLTNALLSLAKDWTDRAHAEGRQEMRRVYFDEDVEIGNSCEKLCSIITQLIDGVYVPFNWDSKERPSILDVLHIAKAK